MTSSTGFSSDPYGLTYARQHAGAAALPRGDIGEIMSGLEWEVKFAKEELDEEIDNIIADLEDDSHEEATRKRKKASVLVDMMGEE